MRTFTKCLAWVLALSLCLGALGIPAYAADADLNYFYNQTAANSASNELVAGAVTGIDTPDPTQGTHVLLGENLYSAYASAFVWGTKGSSETKPVLVDENGTEYWVRDAHSVFENRGFYLDEYYVDGKHFVTPEGERQYARWATVQNFVLEDTGSKNFSTAYCVDQITEAKAGYYYNIENLEDASYFNDYQAQMVRAIALSGYWGQPSGTGSVAAMKEKLAASGEFTADELALLTDGVAMTATQYALWHFSNAGDSSADVRKQIGAYWYGTGDAEHLPDDKEDSVALIFKIYRYLINMDPSSVESTTANTVISKKNFVTAMGVTNADQVEGHENNADDDADNDAYTADVTFTMGVLPKSTAGDDLVAQLVDAKGNVLVKGRIAGELQENEVMLTGTNGTYTFEDLLLIEGNHKLKVKLTGHQQLEQGVYLYNPVGGRTESQTLIGVAEGTHTVDVAMDWDLKFSVNEPPERIITIHKQTPGGLALPGIQFDFYCVAGRDEYLSGETKLPQNAADYTNLPAVPDYTIVTDENGNGTFNLTENNLPDGVYLVVEQEHPAIVAPVDPFYVIIPGTNEDGTELVYRIDITPKNDVRGDVTIEKDVIELGNDLSNENAYDPHRWIISTSIPADIGIGKSFVISDTLDNRLDYLGNVRVTVENANGSIISATLTEGRDYSLSVVDNDSLAEGKPADAFTVSLTKAGMEKVASATTTGITHIRVYFDAQINANAQMGEMIPNQASLSYTNSVGVSFNPVSDIPKVYTGGARLKKVDANDNTVVLAGAEFKLYRIATEEEKGDESIEKVTIEGMVESMVAVPFFNNPKLTGEKSNTAVSGEDGYVYIYGLVEGEYYLVETKAPAGYNLPGKPITITIDENSHKDENVITVVNVSGAMLPETGGVGTAVFTVPGLMLALAAAVLLLQKKRKNA